MNENNKQWIYVGCNHVSDIMPEEDCEVWVARGMGEKGWIQKIPYYIEQGYFDWDGIFAWQPVTNERPEPYIMRFAGNKRIICEEIL